MTRAKVTQNTCIRQDEQMEVKTQRTLANPIGLADLLLPKNHEDLLDRRGLYQQFRDMPTPLRDHTYSRSASDCPKPQSQSPVTTRCLVLEQAVRPLGLEPWEAQEESASAHQNMYRESLRRQGHQAMQRTQLHPDIAIAGCIASPSKDSPPLASSHGSEPAQSGAGSMSSPSRLPPGLIAQDNLAERSIDGLEFLCSSPSRVPPGLDAPQTSPQNYRAQLQINGERILQRSPVKRPQHDVELEIASTQDTISDSPRTSIVASEECEQSRGSRTSLRTCLTYPDEAAEPEQTEKHLPCQSWQRYIDPTLGKNWWCNADGDFFFEETSTSVCHSECGTWQRFKDTESGRYWWWHKERDESFYEPANAINDDKPDV